jgi:alpha-glucuronidase
MTAPAVDPHAAWLGYPALAPSAPRERVRAACTRVTVLGPSPTLREAGRELVTGLESLLGGAVALAHGGDLGGGVRVGTAAVPELAALAAPGAEEFVIVPLPARDGAAGGVAIVGGDERGCLYGAFALLRRIAAGEDLPSEPVHESPVAPLRMLDHWDNLDGTVERGYAGGSIFFTEGEVTRDLARVRAYGRLLASIGVNAVALNNVNVARPAVELLTPRHLGQVARVAATLHPFGVRIALSVSFASPVVLDGLPSADPRDPSVEEWWRAAAARVYEAVPDLLGFVVKASSEGQPGPHSYGASQAEGANVIAAALEPLGGVVLWRAFVYDCEQDWRDTATDRAKAAYEEFIPLDGAFAPNVAVQIKNGPMDYQVREPPSPLLGGAPRTNQLLEVQITQEYTGQQVHVCYLVPLWKEVLGFDTHARGEGPTVCEAVVAGGAERALAGMVGVANVGDERNWTGHLLAQANLYGFGRLAWQPSLPAEVIAREWAALTFGLDEAVLETVTGILMDSREVYESYTSPLGLGWMVTPAIHYGPSPEGYEYSRWGTYIRADREAIGVDRGTARGTGFTAQYHEPWRSIFEDRERCPQELLLFFHRVGYAEVLPSGAALAQHVYDSHFAGVEAVCGFIARWERLRGRIDPPRHASVARRLQAQRESAEEWRDVINAYFHRYSGIDDAAGRRLY